MLVFRVADPNYLHSRNPIPYRSSLLYPDPVVNTSIYKYCTVQLGREERGDGECTGRQRISLRDGVDRSTKRKEGVSKSNEWSRPEG